MHSLTCACAYIPTYIPHVFPVSPTVYVFEPQSSELVAYQQFISKSRPTSAVFVPRIKASDSCAVWNEKSSLMYITEDQVRTYICILTYTTSQV